MCFEAMAAVILVEKKIFEFHNSMSYTFAVNINDSIEDTHQIRLGFWFFIF
jgi:hypothetical protein